MLPKPFLIRRYPKYLRLLWWHYVTPSFVSGTGVKAAKKNSLLWQANYFICAEFGYRDGRRGCTLFGQRNDITWQQPPCGTAQATSKRKYLDRGTGMSASAICAAKKITIGRSCLIGANVSITDTDFHPVNSKGRRAKNNPNDITASPVSIGDNVFIGSGSIILKGVNIGENCVIGAGSVVTRCVPPNSIFAGNPAKLIKYI